VRFATENNGVQHTIASVIQPTPATRFARVN
jgi:hypothetical protein